MEEQTTILVVEDEKWSQRLLTFHLTRWGFKSLLAEDGIAALDILAENQVDLIISDQNMPRMDGMELLKVVKSKYRNIPFIILTAHESIEKAVTSIKQGAYDYIQKPLNAEVMHVTIIRALGYHQLNEENKKLKETGSFREDLCHRINSFPITLPPLREHREDIPFLANYFFEQYRREFSKRLSGISDTAMDALINYHWPGNIRELKNCLERAAIIADGEYIKTEYLIMHDGKILPEPDGKINMQITIEPDKSSLDSVIDRVLQIALERCGNNKSLAVEFLKVGRKIFYRRGG